MIFTQPVVYEFDQLEVPTLLIIGTRDRTALGKNLVSNEVKATLDLMTGKEKKPGIKSNASSWKYQTQVTFHILKLLKNSSLPLWNI